MNRDAVIDATARAMTQYEPSPDFRARVLSRLDATPRRRWLPLIVSMATAATGVAAVLIVWRPDLSHPVQESTPTPIQVPASAAQATNTRVASAEPSGRPPATAEQSSNRPIPAEELAWQARALPLLSDVPPVIIEPIQPSALSIAPIVVTPLVTEPLVVPPVDSGGAGRAPSSPVPQFPSSPVS